MESGTRGGLTGSPVLKVSAAARMEFSIIWYPAQRHSVSFKAKRISSLVGFGFRSSKAYAVIICPGIQNPHCTAPCSTKACCNGWSPPLLWGEGVGVKAEVNPSIVTIVFPSARGWIHAREHRLIIHKHSTRPALRLFTANLCPCETQTITKQVRKHFIWLGFE